MDEIISVILLSFLFFGGGGEHKLYARWRQILNTGLNILTNRNNIVYKLVICKCLKFRALVISK
jgi:hypothetical protein